MNKSGHVLNAALLAVGLGVILEPSMTDATGIAIAQVSLPIVLGALFPDVDTAFGDHRKTLHNLLVLGIALAYPFFFGNLQFVWLGVATHYVLDIMGSTRGIALLYPWGKEFGFPTGVTTDSALAIPVTIAVTAIELAALWAIFHAGLPVDVSGIQSFIAGGVGEVANTPTP
jgi:hypothetical protein